MEYESKTAFIRDSNNDSIHSDLRMSAESHDVVGESAHVDCDIIEYPCIPVAKPKDERGKVYKRTTVAIISLIVFSGLITLKLTIFEVEKILWCATDMLYSDFYVELVSNVSEEYFPNNTVSNFITKLSNRMHLDGEWEVGLAEISYSYSWYNVRKNFTLNLVDGEDPFRIFNKKERLVLDVMPGLTNALLKDKKISDSIYMYTPPPVTTTGILKAGHYQDGTSLIDEINKELSIFNIIDLPKLAFNKISNKVTVYPGEPNSTIYPSFEDELKEILGLKDMSLLSDLPYEGDRPVEISAGFHSLYVYCDIVHPQIIGNKKARLLRAVAVPRDVQFGGQVVIIYDNPHYLPVLYNEFETIEIHIKDDTNNDIPFNFGRSRIKLHFRKRK